MVEMHLDWKLIAALGAIHALQGNAVIAPDLLPSRCGIGRIDTFVDIPGKERSHFLPGVAEPIHSRFVDVGDSSRGVDAEHNLPGIFQQGRGQFQFRNHGLRRCDVRTVREHEAVAVRLAGLDQLVADLKPPVDAIGIQKARLRVQGLAGLHGPVGLQVGQIVRMDPAIEKSKLEKAFEREAGECGGPSRDQPGRLLIVGHDNASRQAINDAPKFGRAEFGTQFRRLRLGFVTHNQADVREGTGFDAPRPCTHPADFVVGTEDADKGLRVARCRKLGGHRLQTGSVIGMQHHPPSVGVGQIRKAPPEQEFTMRVGEKQGFGGEGPDEDRLVKIPENIEPKLRRDGRGSLCGDRIHGGRRFCGARHTLIMAQMGRASWRLAGEG